MWHMHESLIDACPWVGAPKEETSNFLEADHLLVSLAAWGEH
jgi:hypothetical protein